MAIPVIIVLLVVYFYVLVILLCYLEIGKETDSANGAAGLPGRNVSILVPFRNEQDHIGHLAGDLGKQSFPPGQWEVLFIDDQSTDDSERILAPFLTERANFHYHRLPPGVSGKKEAISCGIQHAAHDRIIQVDADCRISPGFISSHMSFLVENPSDLVAGLVTTGRERGNFMETFERLDMLALAGVGAGSFNLGRPLMCSGANLNYSRQLYLETRAFDPGSSVPSGDDMFLMIGARKLGKTLSFNLYPQSMVTTAPVKNWLTLVGQRIRWGGKSARYRMPDIQIMALWVSLTNIAILLLPLWLFLYTGAWPWLAGACAMKLLTDFVLLFRMTGITGSRKDLMVFIPATLLYYPYFLITVLGALLGKAAWKDKPK
jgi:glycosyltransferase involved in cell wall biosynthesis